MRRRFARGRILVSFMFMFGIIILGLFRGLEHAGRDLLCCCDDAFGYGEAF